MQNSLTRKLTCPKRYQESDEDEDGDEEEDEDEDEEGAAGKEEAGKCFMRPGPRCATELQDSMPRLLVLTASSTACS